MSNGRYWLKVTLVHLIFGFLVALGVAYLSFSTLRCGRMCPGFVEYVFGRSYGMILIPPLLSTIVFGLGSWFLLRKYNPDFKIFRSVIIYLVVLILISLILIAAIAYFVEGSFYSSPGDMPEIIGSILVFLVLPALLYGFVTQGIIRRIL